MRSHGVGKWLMALVALGAGVGAAPAAPSYHAVERAIGQIRQDWARPGAVAQPNAPGWNAFFDALLANLRSYSAASNENERLAALNRAYQMSVALAGVGWRPASMLREELRAWLRPRVRLAWAERRLVDHVRGMAPSADPGVLGNRQRWIQFVGQELGEALKIYDAAPTVAQRHDALERVYGALDALQEKNLARPWIPSVELQSALNDLYNIPNLDLSADVATVAPALSANVVESGPIYRKGYVSMVTAGPRTGFGLLPSDEGIAFYNSQLATSVTPITDFQSQMQQDRRGRRASKLYQFAATSTDSSQITITAILTPSGLRLGPSYQHNVGALVTSFKQPGKGFGRFIASLLGFNQAKITQKVFEGAYPRIQQNVVQESAELGAERAGQAEAQKNAQLAQYLIGGNMATFRNLLIRGLTLRSRPENVLIGGTLQWLNARQQVGAYAPQPAGFVVPASGVSADIHLSSVMTNLIRGYLESQEARSVQNLMVVTRNAPPEAPPEQKATVTRNADFATYLKAVQAARAANDPKVMALRVKRPDQPPAFEADANGYLVALVKDFQLEVPAPPQAGPFGPRAQVYRIVSPRIEVSISFRVTPQTQKSPIRLAGRVEDFDPGQDAQILAVNEDEHQAQPLNRFTSTVALNLIRNRIRGQAVDLPLSNLQLRGFAIREVSPLDPSGWIRAVLVRTSPSPAAGVQ